jgi:hypothetical protein
VGDTGIEVEDLGDGTAGVTVPMDPLGASAEELARVVGDLVEGRAQNVVVDFTGAGLLNSKLLDALVRASARQIPGTGGIAVVVAQSYARHMLTVGEAGGLLLLAGSREEALEALREGRGG